LGSRVGWSPARIEDLDREIRALSISHPLIDEYWDCFNVGLFNDYMALRAQLGEVGTARSDLTRALKKKQMEWLKSRSKDWRGLGATVH
jgi:tRNA A37 N6-isopentenylltransferase MiaA